MLADILARHRGPYIFCVVRPSPKKKGFYKSEWLKGSTEREDVGPEAMALLTDPRDTVIQVAVWSEREASFVTVIRGKKDL